jgi:hypothetical protein
MKLSRKRIGCRRAAILLSACLAPGLISPLPGQVSRTISRGHASRQQAPPKEPVLFKMRVDDDGYVIADLRNVPLQRALQELADRTGVVFELGMQDTATASVSLYRVGLREAIERIAADHDCIYYYGRDAAGQERLEFVRVFSRAGNVQQPSLIYLGTGAITKTGDDAIDTPEQALKVLAGSGDIDARQEAIEVLVASKTDLSEEALAAAAGDPAPEVRAAAIEGLAALGDRKALPVVVQALKDKHPGVRHSAITAVALLGDSRELQYLHPMERDPDASVAAAAEMAIRRLATPRP